MLISHECPIQLLEESRSFNDYDYSLVHLLGKLDVYRKFYEKSVSLGRRVILDNSLYELGKAFESGAFAKWVEDLKPTIYIVPDSFNDKQGTIDFFNQWEKNYKHVPGLKMGVIHGNTYQELADCYRYMKDHADMIGISFGYGFFDSIGVGANREQRQANGRPKLVRSLVDDGIWDISKPHHLLGCALPQEAREYPDSASLNIASMDTSSPILHGIMGIAFDEKSGLYEKNPTKMNDVFECELTQKQIQLIHSNMRIFRTFVS